MYKISVIVPVYNVERFLRECLDSLVNQTLKELEFICVNDGSTDGSLAILEEYAAKDDRFVIISQKNQGQGIARNNALEIARGEYIAFVDPDDWIELNVFEVLYDKFVKTGVDVIYFDYDIYSEAGKLRSKREFKNLVKRDFHYSIKNGDIFNWHDIPKKNLTMTVCIWDKAYKTDFIKKNNIKFAPNTMGEDHIFSLSANLLADKILYINRHFYHYRTRKGSAINKASDENFCIFNNVRLLKEFLVSNNLYAEYEKVFKEYEIRCYLWHYRNIPENSIERYLKKCEELLTPEEYKKLLQKINSGSTFWERIFSVKNQKRLGVKTKVLTILGVRIPIKRGL